jgi:zinc transport system permease protein
LGITSLSSGLTNLPSGPCLVIVQFLGFMLALLVRVRSLSP